MVKGKNGEFTGTGTIFRTGRIYKILNDSDLKTHSSARDVDSYRVRTVFGGSITGGEAPCTVSSVSGT